jgi:hypothetical protein
MNDVKSIPVGHYAEVRVYPQAEGTDDASDMYVLDALGVTLLVRRRTDGSTRVHIDTDGIDAFHGPLRYEVRSGGEYGDDD